MSLMLFHVLEIDQNVINENHATLVQFYHEYGVHQIHEVSGGIGQPERHNLKFTKAISGGESSLGNISFTYFDLMITLSKINFEKHFSPRQLTDQEVNAGQRVLVLDHHRIEWPVIDTQL
jgi:hypothetical protein